MKSWTQREGDPSSNYKFLARVAAGDPMRLVPALEKLVREVDPSLRLRTPQTYSELVDRSIMTERMMATLGGFFGDLALMVASLGIFGVMAFQVSRRINELGCAWHWAQAGPALGASRASIVALIVREVAAMVAVGSSIGAAAALIITGLAAVILGGTAFTAGWLPALRAARVDPVISLRHE